MASIGAYAVERDYSHYVAYATKTVLAVISTATKGPVGVATPCTSTQDLINKFGHSAEGMYGSYAAQYFLSQSSRVYFVRAAGTGIAGASVTLKDTDDTKDALIVTMKDKGTYYNGYQVVVTANESNYDLEIRTPAGNSVEVIKDKSFTDLVEGTTESDIVTITGVTSTTATDLKLGSFPLSGGDDGTASPAYKTAAESLIAESVDVNLVVAPGVTDKDAIGDILRVVENKGDCLYIIDAPKDLEMEGVVDWVNGTGSSSGAKLNSSYGAVYYDWVYIYDSYRKVQVLVPPSVTVCETYAYSDRISELWYAPAGLTRGLLRGVIESRTKLSRGDVDYLYSNNINAIYDDPQMGLVLWGQKTLSRDDTALNRVNVRRLMNYLKKVIVAACNSLTFEPNDRITWNSFEMKVTPILQGIQNRRGIYEFNIVKGETIVTDEDIDNYRMPCMVMIRPTKAAEEIPIYFVITSTGADFNEVLEANGVVIN